MADKKISALTLATTPLAGTEVLPIVQSGSTVKVPVSDLTAGRNVTTADLYAIGNLGVNTNTPSSPLHVYRNTTNGTNANVLAQNAGATGSYAGFQAIAGTVDFQIFSDAAGNAIGTPGTMMRTNSNTPLLFGINSSEVARFDTSGNLVPKTAAKGINFTANTGAAGMTSQLLNWYEEGTWTPVFAPSSGAFGSVTYNAIRGARYTRIGNVVHVQGAIATDAITVGTAANNVWITGLPFTAVSNTGSTNDGFSDISIGYSSNFAVNVPSHGYVTAGTTRLELYYRLTANGASTSLNVTDLSTTDKNYVYFSASYNCS